MESLERIDLNFEVWFFVGYMKVGSKDIYNFVLLFN